jgi:anti-sigma B factor antagonist
MPSTVAIIGDLTQETAEEARARALAALTDEGLVLDLKEVPFISTPGIGLLLELQKFARLRGGQLKLHAVQPRVAEVIRRTQLDRVLHMD